MRLALFLFGVIASTLAGTAVVAALVAGVSGLWGLLAAAGAGAVVAAPVSVAVARALGGWER